MADNTLKSELRNTWESAAPGWARWEHVFAASLSDATDALIDIAGIRPGMRVLDIACGAGSQSIQAAKRVSASGSVVASDISGTMLEHVRRNAARAGLTNIETLECAADELDEKQAPFDAAICRLGLMLFPSRSFGSCPMCTEARRAAQTRRRLLLGPEPKYCLTLRQRCTTFPIGRAWRYLSHRPEQEPEISALRASIQRQ